MELRRSELALDVDAVGQAERILHLQPECPVPLDGCRRQTSGLRHRIPRSPLSPCAAGSLAAQESGEGFEAAHAVHAVGS